MSDRTDGKPRTTRRRLGSIVIDRRPLKIPPFRRLWVSSLVTAIGSQLTAVAVPKQVFDITGSSAYVGLTGVFGLVPLLIFGIWGGAIADTVDRRKLLLVTNTGIAATACLLWAQAYFDVGSVWVVLSLLAVNQAFFAVNMPTRNAVVARLVPTELLPSASALTGTMTTFGAVFGPLAAGALLPIVGLSTLYLVDSVALIVVVWAVWRLPPLPPQDGRVRRAGLRDITDGFRYLGAQKILLASFVVDIIAMVAGMPRALFPEMAERTFGDPAGGGLALGWLYAAIPLGAMLLSLMSGWASRVSRHGVVVVVAIAVWGVAIAGFGMSQALWLSIVFLVIAGAADMASSIFRMAILQTAATDEMRGRTQGVFTVVVAGGPRLADLTHGWAAAGVGTAAAATGGGLLVLVGLVIAVVLTPAFWRYRAPVTRKNVPDNS
ncbi:MULTISPECIES: MFS transporter [Prauserella salsuginis group]|uniref:MFS transporter n=1 Tax=Prauserella salsuginis TaxID=387889 RepID=A0ABW6GAN1_9PSEU|nr:MULTISPECIES: MFS transporter [Prauserella salsuginis group]MCR3720675.1 putative arabinose efflux permease, MFS family [Prauserella flava]MCR3735244.1 putative arabinose efflux permease, MFS family [Prauserella salsuginis]